MKPRFVFRDFPGVNDLESLFDSRDKHPNRHWAPETEQIVERADRLSLAIFGISLLSAQRLEAYAEEQDEPPPQQDPRDLLDTEADCTMAIWDDDIWDITRADGRPLRCYRLFQASITCAYNGDAQMPDEPSAREADAERVARSLIDSGWTKRKG